MSDELILATLAQQSDGSPGVVEFLRTGTFTDMRGRRVEVTDKMLDALVANFDSGAAQQDVPIDILHQQAEAAGWVQRIWRDGDRLFGAIDWNELGRNLVGARIYRYLSATLDLGNMVLRAISLCNFPAVKGLSPVALSEILFAGEESLGQRIERIRMAYELEFIRSKGQGYMSPEMEDSQSEIPWVIDVWDSYIIVHQQGDTYWKIEYVEGEGGEITFKHEDAVEVKRDWVEAQEGLLASTETVVHILQRAGTEAANSAANTMEAAMSDKTAAPEKAAEKTAAQQEQPKAEAQPELFEEKTQPAAELTEPTAPAPAKETTKAAATKETSVASASADLMAQLREEMNRELAEFRQGLADVVREVSATRREVATKVIGEIAAEQELRHFSERVTSQGQFALPLQASEVRELLQDMPEPHRSNVRKVLETITNSGTVDFREMGTAKAAPITPSAKLDPNMAQTLRLFVKNGGSVDEFFELNADILGKKSQYDLTEVIDG